MAVLSRNLSVDNSANPVSDESLLAASSIPYAERLTTLRERNLFFEHFFRDFNLPAPWCHGKECIFRNLLRRIASDHWDPTKFPLRDDASDRAVFWFICTRARLTAREFQARYQSYIWTDNLLTKNRYKRMREKIGHYARLMELVEEGGSLPSADVLWQDFRNSTVDGMRWGKSRRQSAPGRMECVWAEQGSP